MSDRFRIRRICKSTFRLCLAIYDEATHRHAAGSMEVARQNFGYLDAASVVDEFFDEFARGEILIWKFVFPRSVWKHWTFEHPLVIWPTFWHNVPIDMRQLVKFALKKNDKLLERQIRSMRRSEERSRNIKLLFSSHSRHSSRLWPSIMGTVISINFSQR